MSQVIKREDIRDFFKTTFEEAGYSKCRVSMFCKSAERLHEYMSSNNIEGYTPEAGEAFIRMESISEQVGAWMLRTDSRAITVINMILAGEPITFHARTAVRTYPGEVGAAAEAFLAYLESEVRSSQGSLARYGIVLSAFSIYCSVNGITVENMSYAGIVGYMSSKQNADSKTTSVLRIFFRHLHEIGRLDKDYSLEIADLKQRRREKMLSYYSREEVIKLEESIERTCTKGRRDYAIIKLASRLGLRSSDIASLKFSDIDWERNTIRMKQQKTQKYVELPLLADVGNAIIDYLQNGRPEDSHKQVFLTCRTPYRPLNRSLIFGMVASAMVKAGINIRGRRHGAHSLRHSLAYNMLGSGSTLGTISSALGHTSVESTMAYLGVDLNGLMECSLPVPPVDGAFYDQSGGLLYD